jgi:hypothetical protein
VLAAALVNQARAHALTQSATANHTVTSDV